MKGSAVGNLACLDIDRNADEREGCSACSHADMKIAPCTATDDGSDGADDEDATPYTADSANGSATRSDADAVDGTGWRTPACCEGDGDWCATP